MSVISATNVYFCRGKTTDKHTLKAFDVTSKSLTVPHLSVPDGVDGVSNDGRPSLLPVVAKDGEDAPLPGVDGHLQVRVRVEEHALLQADSSQVCKRRSGDEVFLHLRLQPPNGSSYPSE